MPFGLDLKSIIIGIILGMVVIPRVMAMVSNARGAAATTTA